MRKLIPAVLFGLACTLALAPVALAQRGPAPSWDTAGGNPQLTGDQPLEPRITAANVQQIHELWKIKLPHAKGSAPSEPLFVGRLITEHGFRDTALVLAPAFEGVNLYGIDYELGHVMWRHYIDVQGSAAQDCPNGQFADLALQPVPVINFAAFARRGARGRRGGPPARRGPGAPPPGPTRLIFGVNAGGFFRARTVFVLTSDGMVRGFRTANGALIGAPVKAIPYRDSDLSDPTIAGQTFYVSSTADCGGNMQENGVWQAEPNSVFAVNSASASYPMSNFDAGSNLSGIAQSTDGKTLYVATGTGNGAHPNGVLALDAATLALKDYYQAPSAAGAEANMDVSPVVFPYDGRDLVAAYTDEGRLVLLDSATLGGADHHTPLAKTARLTDPGAPAWGRLATAEINGARWIFVSVHGAPAADLHLAGNGPAGSGAELAFKVDNQGARTVLTPAWASANLVNPSPAIVANGLVYVLANGTESTHATLVALNAATGATEYSSGAAIPEHAHRASIAMTNGQILFLTADDTLYNFGIGIQHGLHH